jgi:effector-binding domain-containing protein
MRRLLLIVVAGWVAGCWTSLWAEEDIKYPSPDGRFALRITQSKDNEDHPTVELIEKDSGKVMVTLHSGSYTDVFDASDSLGAESLVT